MDNVASRESPSFRLETTQVYTEFDNRSDQTPCAEFANRNINRIKNIFMGAMVGGLAYSFLRLLIKVGLMSQRRILGVSPLSMILVGAVSASITQLSSLIQDVVLSFLGKRENSENLALPKPGVCDRLRQRSWKVITCFEKLESKIDRIFSRFFHIRTIKEIRERNSADEMSRIEIIRRIFLEQSFEMIQGQIPMALALYSVQALGYTVMIAPISVIKGVIYAIAMMTFMKAIQEINKETLNPSLA